MKSVSSYRKVLLFAPSVVSRPLEWQHLSWVAANYLAEHHRKRGSDTTGWLINDTSPSTYDNWQCIAYIKRLREVFTWWWRYYISWLCGWHESSRSATVTSAVLVLQCIYGDTEEATQLWLNAWRSWTITRLTTNSFPHLFLFLCCTEYEFHRSWYCYLKCTFLFFYSQLFIYFLISQKHVYLSSGVFRVSEREGKNVDFEAKSAPPGVQFLEWTFSQTRPQHLWNAHISSQGIYITYIKTAWLVFLWISLHRLYLSSKRLLCTL